MPADMTRKFPRPQGHHTITPGVTVEHAPKVIELIERAFGGKVLERYDGPNGMVFHAELLLGDSVVMLGSGQPGYPPMPASLSFYVDTGEQVDATYRRALDAGAKSITEPKNQFYGYRSACVQDAGGNKWTICAVVEQLTKEEVERRMQEMKP